MEKKSGFISAQLHSTSIFDKNEGVKCVKCGQIKPIKDFYVENRMKICKKCFKSEQALRDKKRRDEKRFFDQFSPI